MNKEQRMFLFIIVVIVLISLASLLISKFLVDEQKKEYNFDIYAYMQSIDDCWQPLHDYVKSEEYVVVCNISNLLPCYESELKRYKLKEERDICLIKIGAY